jgi:hypothetical protein
MALAVLFIVLGGIMKTFRLLLVFVLCCAAYTQTMVAQSPSANQRHLQSGDDFLRRASNQVGNGEFQRALNTLDLASQQYSAIVVESAQTERILIRRKAKMSLVASIAFGKLGDPQARDYAQEAWELANEAGDRELAGFAKQALAAFGGNQDHPNIPSQPNTPSQGKNGTSNSCINECNQRYPMSINNLSAGNDCIAACGGLESHSLENEIQRNEKNMDYNNAGRAKCERERSEAMRSGVDSTTAANRYARCLQAYY